MGSPKQKENVVRSIGKCLPRPTIVRWGSLYNSIEQIVEHEEEIIRMIQRFSLQSSLRDLDFKYSNDFFILMKPIVVTLDKLQGDVTYGYLLPRLVSLRNNLSDLITQKKLRWCNPLATMLIESFQNRFKPFFHD